MQLRGLGYLVIETSESGAWHDYLVDAIGLMPGEPPNDHGLTWFRMDDRSYRIAVEDAVNDSYVAGWELASSTSWDDAVTELESAGVLVEHCDAEQARRRGVGGLARLADPFGNRHELFWGHQVSEAPFDSPKGMSGFCTASLGLGHVLYAVPSSDVALSFFRDTLGMKVTDYFTWGENSAWFLRCNERHHAVAFVDLPLPGGPGVNHFMLEARTLADVGRALDRSIDMGFEIVNSLGQHSNDKCVSYYMRSPGTANVEVGFEQLRINDDDWEVIAWTGRGDYWGHRGPFMDEIADSKN